MALISWDETTKHLFNAGLNQGVLYGEENKGVSWNGLISIDETANENTTTTHLDGLKVATQHSKSDFQATLTAFTFPDEFLAYQGIDFVENSGMIITGQTSNTFCLSYKTLVGNDVEGTEFGYQIHILYNLVAEPQDVSYSTISSNVSPTTFSWKLSGTPSFIPDFHPTSHIIIDSRYIDDAVLVLIEDFLYGVENREFVIQPAEINEVDNSDSLLSASVSDEVEWDPYIEVCEVSSKQFDATLPPLDMLTRIVKNFDPKLIQPDNVTGFASFIPGYGDITNTYIDGVFEILPRTRLVPVYKGQYYALEIE